MKIVDNNILKLSNGLKFLYNPKIFNFDTVLAQSLKKTENSLTEELLLKFNSMFNIHEVNFVGTNKIIFKTDRSIYISIEFTKNKITSIRTRLSLLQNSHIFRCYLMEKIEQTSKLTSFHCHTKTKLH